MASKIAKLKALFRPAIYAVRRYYARHMPRRVYLVQTEPDQGVLPLEKKIAFYFEGSGYKLERIGLRSLRPILGHGPVLLYGPQKTDVPLWHRLFNGDFDVNERTFAMEGWSWFDAQVHLEGLPDPRIAKANFTAWRESLDPSLNRAYLFATGPSLSQAIDRDWSDGFRIVCNTIVRDRELWHHINPHAITAGDAIYHFGYTEFARSFRRDLLDRLRESPKTVLIYPDYFHSSVISEIPIEPHRLIPVPTGKDDTVHRCLNDNFELPALGNVLNKLLLPIGCALSHGVRLWGFDGRAPDDTLFWANSNKHTYPELMHTLQTAHPSFFNHFVPKSDPEQYVRSVHGDVLEHCFAKAEADGFTFEMLHKSWTETLERRRVAG